MVAIPQSPPSSLTASNNVWVHKNQKYLAACIDQVQALLERRIFDSVDSSTNIEPEAEAKEKEGRPRIDSNNIGKIKSVAENPDRLDFSSSSFTTIVEKNENQIAKRKHEMSFALGKKRDQQRISSFDKKGHPNISAQTFDMLLDGDNNNKNTDKGIFVRGDATHITGNHRPLLDSLKTKSEGKDNAKNNNAHANDNQDTPAYALDSLCHLFGLSNFERMVILLCSGAELKSVIANLCAKANGEDPNSQYATFELALSLFENAHWSAISPTSPLRRFKLITVVEYQNVPVVKCPIKIEERVLHYLLGVSYVDRRLYNVLTPLSDKSGRIFTMTPQSHHEVVEKIMMSCSGSSDNRHRDIQVTDNDNHDVDINNRGCNVAGSSGTHFTSFLVHLWGSDRVGKESIVRKVCDKNGLDIYQLHFDSLLTKSSSPSDEIGTFVDLLCREALLLRSAILITLVEGDPSSSDAGTALSREILTIIASNILRCGQPVFLSTPDRLPPSLIAMLSSEKMVSFEISKLEKSEQRQIWHECLLNSMTLLQRELQFSSSTCTSSSLKCQDVSKPAIRHAMQRGKRIVITDIDLWSITDNFDFNLSEILSAIDKTVLFERYSQPPQTRQEGSAPKTHGKKQYQNRQERSSYLDSLWKACREQSAPNVAADHLAIQIVPKSTLDDLVLPEYLMQLLKWIVMHVKNRSKVYGDWGFGTQRSIGGRGLGLSALFEGESGTGKTMAAEALANYLDLDLYKIDLASVVSKYIGETEKNLKRVFDAAERGGAILFFDEADALFGRRSEVKDSHDRYANIEVGYLLQRLEQYKGLAILATNMRTNLDPAFVRRLKFIVKFPFPDEESRTKIWSKVFPKLTPTSELDFRRLAKLNIAGGNIRNIALNASFMAADHDQPVSMKHLMLAVRLEYEKMGKNLSSVERAGIGGYNND